MAAAITRRPQQPTARDVDLLLLIREEEIYSNRIRDSLVLIESRITREPALLAPEDQAIRQARRALYSRPISLAERSEEEESIIAESRVRSRRRSRSRTEGTESSISVSGSIPYENPPTDRRRTVDDEDAEYSESSSDLGRLMFSYEDLIATREKRKNISVRSLRRLANIWRKDPKLNKKEMLAQLISEYQRRYPEEVEAYERKRSPPNRGGGGRR